MKVINRLKIGTKINLIVLIIILTFSAIISYVVMNNMSRGLKDIALEKAKSDLTLAYEYIDAKYPGSWKVEDGSLYKGDTEMNENYELVDAIGEMTGDTVTIFQGDTRIATNVMIEGERAIGTQVSAEVKAKVMDEEEIYYGEAEVVGNMYQSAYSPIINDSGEVIGIWYVGASEAMIDNTIYSFMRIFFIVLVIIVILSIISVLLFSRSIRSRLVKISQAMSNAGDGDFTYVVEDKSKDEIGELVVSLGQMRENLSDLLQTISHTSEQVAASSEELSASAEESSKSSEVVAQSTQKSAEGTELTLNHVEQVVSSVENMKSGVQVALTNSKEVLSLSSRASDNSNEGSVAVEAVVKQMNEISMSVNEISGVVTDLGEKSKEIGTIVGLIREISEQTNLLALNAAIEAARAGEHGKGFAVVASEVRKLAEQSSKSTEHISRLIEDIQNETNKAVEAMNQGTVKVEEGINKTGNVSESFQSIQDVIGDVTANVREVSSTIEDISSKSQQIVEAMAHVRTAARDSVESNETNASATQQQLATMEEISASSETLSDMAQNLQAALSKFKF
ncbi:methyl-accepting chemotaxis protein [Radiobacillus kanasensis]|uniref:methyl-accepting chemotaxis protein n=1 Tax=Radiobacillus kanasensis TaxID=2844358 RepID=UPI001E3D027E|nr:methyl-accepting chemotaxis protein [Radiobacillus kanasensis]UFU01119.1 methyl-accepting chemotaxis protein [Radiobacillus kanasensis]